METEEDTVIIEIADGGDGEPSTPLLSHDGVTKNNPISVEQHEEDRDLQLANTDSLLDSNTKRRGFMDLCEESQDCYLYYEDDDLGVLESDPGTTPFTRRSERKSFASSSVTKKGQSSDSRNDDDVPSDFLCKICFDPKPQNESFRIKSCSHTYCTDCISKYVGVELQDNITSIPCPVSECKGFLEPEYCRDILPREVFDRWGDALCEAIVIGVKKFYCPFKDCSALLIDDGGEVVRASECPYCRRLFCAQCRVPWHVDIDCEAFQKLKVGFLCEICFDQKPQHESFRIKSCSHTYCTDCMSKYVGTKLQDNITLIPCPFFECKGFLEPEYCRDILPREVFDRWGDALCEAIVIGVEKFYCPFKDCSALLIDDGDEAVRASECPYCRRLFCAQCRVPWHVDIECEAFQKLNKDERGREDIMLKKLAESENWKRCPNCRYYVEKKDGCRFMTCRCGTAFCYTCGSTTCFQTHY